MQLVKEPLSIAPEVVRQMGYAALRAHLVKQFAPLTKEERSRWLQNLFFVLTPDVRQLLEKIEGIRAYRSLGQQRNFLLGGHWGDGEDHVFGLVEQSRGSGGGTRTDACADREERRAGEESDAQPPVSTAHSGMWDEVCEE